MKQAKVELERQLRIVRNDTWALLAVVALCCFVPKAWPLLVFQGLAVAIEGVHFSLLMATMFRFVVADGRREERLERIRDKYGDADDGDSVLFSPAGVPVAHLEGNGNRQTKCGQYTKGDYVLRLNVTYSNNEPACLAPKCRACFMPND